MKARRLKTFSKFFAKLNGRTPPRDALLSLRGVGPETAESILLYACGVPVFVVDSYTRKMLAHEKIIPAKRNFSYGEIQQMFHSALPRDAKIFQEFHALIVREAKRGFGRDDVITEKRKRKRTKSSLRVLFSAASEARAARQRPENGLWGKSRLATYDLKFSSALCAFSCLAFTFFQSTLERYASTYFPRSGP